MTRPAFLAFCGAVLVLLLSPAILAQVALSGPSQYGGLIRSVGSGKCVDVEGASRRAGGNVQLYSCNGGANQKWEFIGLGNGQYAIRSQNSGMVLDVESDSRRDGANVQQYPWNGGANQRWRSQGPNNNFQLVNVGSGKCLDVANGSTANNANIIQWDCRGGSSQRWYVGYSR